MEQIASNISQWLMGLGTLSASLLIIWSWRSRSYFAEVINSFPIQLGVFNTILLLIVCLFSLAIGGTHSLLWYTVIFNTTSIVALFIRVFRYSYIKPNSAATQSQKTFRVGSFNKQIGTPNAELITGHAKELNLDFLGISEVKPQDFKPLLQADFPYSYYTNKRYGIGQAEFLILSKYKLNTTEAIPLDQFGNAQRVGITVDGKDIAIYVVHTTAPISPELFRKRNAGFEILANKMISDKAKHIVMFGDLNLTPYSWVYRRFQAELNKKFYNSTKGWGVHFTWTYLVPFSTQLDHIFVSSNIKTKKFKVDKKLDSDHNLIWADLEV